MSGSGGARRPSFAESLEIVEEITSRRELL